MIKKIMDEHGRNHSKGMNYGGTPAGTYALKKGDPVFYLAEAVAVSGSWSSFGAE